MHDAPEHAPVSHHTSRTKCKLKDKITKDFSIAISELSVPGTRPFLGTHHVHWSQVPEASPGLGLVCQGGWALAGG